MFEQTKSGLKGKIPPVRKWRFLPKVLKEKERLVFFGAISVLFVSLIASSVSFYLSRTERVPAFGGSYSEGMVGYPRFLNPVYSSTSDVDRNIVSLLFSELIYYDFDRGFVPNLVEKISEENGVLRMRLRDGLRWSDGERITAKDVVFTIRVIQDPEYRSPLRPNWVGIEVEEVSELEVVFRLEQPSVVFNNNLSIRIIPKHIWKDISPQNFALSKYNLEPVGSGPYRIKNSTKNYGGNIASLVLEPNPYYHGKAPYIEKISILFFGNEEGLLTAARRGDIDGFSTITPRDYRAIIARTGFEAYRLEIPRYFALFFNLQNEEIGGDMRAALNLAIDKEAIIESVLTGRGERVYSPVPDQRADIIEFNPERAAEILESIGLTLNEAGVRTRVVREGVALSFRKELTAGSQGEEVQNLQKCLLFLTEKHPEIFPDGNVTGFYGQDTREAVIRFQEIYRKDILDPGGFRRGTGMVGRKTRDKLNKVCSEIPEKSIEPVLVITTVDQPLMVQTAEKIKGQWERLGMQVKIEAHDLSILQRDVIKPRNYDILLFGKAFEAVPDLFPFWHSSQKSQFGLNLSMYSNDTADSLMERLRIETNEEERTLLLEKLSELILYKTPAIFLYNPDYLYFVSPRILGVSSGRIITPSDRFKNIENWYIRTRRSVVKK